MLDLAERNSFNHSWLYKRVNDSFLDFFAVVLRFILQFFCHSLEGFKFPKGGHVRKGRRYVLAIARASRKILLDPIYIACRHRRTSALDSYLHNIS
jgi:hypothetical protein